MLGPINWRSWRQQGEKPYNPTVNLSLFVAGRMVKYGLVQRISFFQSAAQEASAPFTVQSMQALIEM